MVEQDLVDGDPLVLLHASMRKVEDSHGVAGFFKIANVAYQ